MPPKVEAGIYVNAIRNSQSGNPVGERAADMWAFQRDMELVAEARARNAQIAVGAMAIAQA
ncbi:MAG TPA: hypothetical protein VFB59_00775 [Candidatus Saccharimonadales bacterium]|nr:hypothetical protein [Candidatus Saccharimonadales bacterium]